jgi:hypothetical protein
MRKTRANIFEEDADFDVSGFAAAKPATAPPREAVRAVSEAANFRSREEKASKSEAGRRGQRRYRTGRNVQLNLKASRQTVDEFYRLADLQGWVLGQALEHAVAALKKELKVK